MNGTTNTHPSQPVTEADESIISVGLSEKAQEQQAQIQQLKNERSLADRKLEDARGEANEKRTYIRDTLPKSDRGEERRKHKSIKRKEIERAWAAVEAREQKLEAREQKLEEGKQKLEEGKQKLADDKRDLDEEKKSFEAAKRKFEVMKNHKSVDSETRNSFSDTDEETVVGGEQEASCYDDAELSPTGEKMDLACQTKNGNLEGLINRELRTADYRTVEGEERFREGISPASSSTGHPATNITTSSTSTQGVGLRGYRACPPWPLCAMLLAVGIAMIIVAFLQLREVKKERNLWLQANGLTRAYLLAIAPAGYVD